MADRRSIEPGLLAHPLFRRASLVAREVWVGLILTADDEGRLRLDPVSLAETIFSPLTHKITAKKMQETFDFWATPHENGKTPWLVIYGEGAYGFLTGWYEHQFIRPAEREKPGDRERRPGQREESSLPPPPVPVNSWQAADAVYHWYCRTKEQKKTYYRLALRALSQLTVAEQQAIVTEELRNLLGVGAQQLQAEGKGGKEEGKGGNGSPPDSVVEAAVNYFTATDPPMLSLTKADAYGRACRAHLKGNSDFADDEIIHAFEANGPLPGKERDFSGNWFERLRRERDGSSGQRSSTAGSSPIPPFVAPPEQSAEEWEAAAEARQRVLEQVRAQQAEVGAQ